MDMPVANETHFLDSMCIPHRRLLGTMHTHTGLSLRASPITPVTIEYARYTLDVMGEITFD